MKADDTHTSAPFDPLDLQRTLNSNFDEAQGRHDLRSWQIFTGKNSTELLTRMVSAHESLHHELNNVTIYGVLLQCFSYLAQEATSDAPSYGSRLDVLLEHCRIAHEVYATGLGFMLAADDTTDTRARELLGRDSAYFQYYKFAARLVRDLDHLFYRQQALVVILRLCFQSERIANEMTAKGPHFDPANIADAEFPNERLGLLLRSLPEKFFKNSLDAFLGQYPDAEALAEFTSQFYTAKSKHGQHLKSYNRFGPDLMRWFYTAGATFFKDAGLPCIGINDQLSYGGGIIAQIDRIFPFARSRSPLKFNEQPFNYDDASMLAFENETWVFAAERLKCEIYYPDEVPPEMHQFILNGVGAPKAVYVSRRERSQLSGHYQFDLPVDQERFEALDDFFTFIRIVSKDKQYSKKIILIPFPTPPALEQFLRDKPGGVRLYGCIATRALKEGNWTDSWKPFFEQFDNAVLLLDTSPLYYIDQVFDSYEKVVYEKLVFSVGETTYTGVVFDLRDAGITQACLLAPATDPHCELIHYYLQYYHPEKYQLCTDGGEKWLPALPQILSCIFREERYFSFHAAPAYQRRERRQ
ncbi:MAG: hypothetical protein V4577_04415 [Bacteroidota bacterium]